MNTSDLIKQLNESFSELLADSNEMFHMNNYSYSENEDGYVIKYTIPGASKEDISVKVKEDIVYVEVKASELYKGLKDAFGVPEDFDAYEITSKYKDGVLLITIPSIEKVESEEVDVKVD